MKFVHVLLFAFLIIHLCWAIEPSENYPQHVTLKDNGQYVLYWKIGGYNGDDLITFEIIAKTTGWIGLGLSPNGAMQNTDIFLGGVDDATNVGYLYVRTSMMRDAVKENRKICENFHKIFMKIERF